MGKMTKRKRNHVGRWQRRMGVEPTRDRAERPLSRFEDGETHRGPYTSMFRTTEQTRNIADSICFAKYF